jgi:hypothetical protein
MMLSHSHFAPYADLETAPGEIGLAKVSGSGRAKPETLLTGSSSPRFIKKLLQILTTVRMRDEKPGSVK